VPVRLTGWGGGTLDAEFVLWASADELQIPESAIFRKDGQSLVFRVVGERGELTTVSTGRTNGFYTVILDGLSEGDLVVRHPDRQLEDGSRVRVR